MSIDRAGSETTPPNRIYLQVDEYPETTWCIRKIHDSDEVYIRQRVCAEAVKALKMEIEHLAKSLWDMNRKINDLNKEINRLLQEVED